MVTPSKTARSPPASRPWASPCSTPQAGPPPPSRSPSPPTTRSTGPRSPQSSPPRRVNSRAGCSVWRDSGQEPVLRRALRRVERSLLLAQRTEEERAVNPMNGLLVLPGAPASLEHRCRLLRTEPREDVVLELDVRPVREQQREAFVVDPEHLVRAVHG